MREIKFKAKLSHSKQWVIGNLVIAQNGQPYIIPSEVFEPDGHHLKIDSDEPYWVDKETISQFTGLTDKNGVEIYEGDVLSDGKGDNGAVRWIDALGGFRVYVDNTLYSLNEGDPNRNTQLEYTEVIGNIHDK